MEEKKNNAVEKAEKVADNNVKKAKNKTSNKKPSAKKSVRAKSKKQNVKAEQKREKKLYEKHTLVGLEHMTSYSAKSSLATDASCTN